jgi:hypothetical protein
VRAKSAWAASFRAGKTGGSQRLAERRSPTRTDAEWTKTADLKSHSLPETTNLLVMLAEGYPPTISIKVSMGEHAHSRQCVAAFVVGADQVVAYSTAKRLMGNAWELSRATARANILGTCSGGSSPCGRTLEARLSFLLVGRPQSGTEEGWKCLV